jgi:hypothetical protein
MRVEDLHHKELLELALAVAKGSLAVLQASRQWMYDSPTRNEICGNASVGRRFPLDGLARRDRVVPWNRFHAVSESA